jgi:nitrogen fixation protein FixH
MTFELKGWHVLAMLLAFFGITIAVNVVFTTYALSTFSGEDVSKPYVRGLEYNNTLAARAAQAKLKWTASIEMVRADSSGADVTVVVTGGNGEPLSALELSAKLRRPTDARLDRDLTLSAIGEGRYRARVDDLAAGQWDVIARVGAAEAPLFEAERRVLLK